MLSSLPDLKPTKTVVTRILATIPAARETPDRARGANGSTALCQSADAGSNPAGSILPSVEKIYTGGENAEIISPSNLTLFPPPPILKLTESCTTFLILMTPDIRGHLRYHQPDKPIPFDPVPKS